MGNESAKVAEVKKPKEDARVKMEYPQDKYKARGEAIEELDKEFEEFIVEEQEKVLKFSPVKNAKDLTVLDHIDLEGILWPRRKWGFLMPPTKSEPHYRPVLKNCPKCGNKPGVDDAVRGTCGKCRFDIKPIALHLVEEYKAEIDQHEKKLRELKGSK